MVESNTLGDEVDQFIVLEMISVFTDGIFSNRAGQVSSSGLDVQRRPGDKVEGDTPTMTPRWNEDDGWFLPMTFSDRHVYRLGHRFEQCSRVGEGERLTGYPKWLFSISWPETKETRWVDVQPVCKVRWVVEGVRIADESGSRGLCWELKQRQS